jgi:tellurite resistance protein
MNPEKKASSYIWRIQSKINECLYRYEKVTKSKKSFDLREAERWIAAMKELLTVKGTPSVAEMAEQ